jgi:hypothetical protein
MIFSNLYPTNKDGFDSLIKKIKKEKTLDILVSSFESFCTGYSCKPDREEYPYPRGTDIIDEYESVKWNREEVRRLRRAFENRAEELTRYKNLISSAFEGKIIEILASDNSISIEESRKIWNYAYSEGHSCGIRNVISYYEEFVSVYADLLKIRKEQKWRD